MAHRRVRHCFSLREFLQLPAYIFPNVLIGPFEVDWRAAARLRITQPSSIFRRARARSRRQLITLAAQRLDQGVELILNHAYGAGA